MPLKKCVKTILSILTALWATAGTNFDFEKLWKYREIWEKLQPVSDSGAYMELIDAKKAHTKIS
jgi:hypothetical protein